MRQLNYSAAVDIWSMGCIFFEMAGRGALFPENDHFRLLKLIFVALGSPLGEDLRFWRALTGWSHVLEDFVGQEAMDFFGVEVQEALGVQGMGFLKSLLETHPLKRPSASDCLAHVYFANKEDDVAKDGPVVSRPDAEEFVDESADNVAKGGPSVLRPAAGEFVDESADGVAKGGPSAVQPAADALSDAQREAWDKDGYFVVPGLIDRTMAANAAKEVRVATERLLKAYGIKAGPDFKVLLRNMRRFQRTPKASQGQFKFGAYSKRAWMQNSGTGRFYENFSGIAVDTCRERTREIVASIHGVPPEALKQQPEKASIKPEGCGPLKWHLDQDRVGTVQVVIALTASSFMMWPGSHKVAIGSPDHKGFYKLKVPHVNEHACACMPCLHALPGGGLEGS